MHFTVVAGGSGASFLTTYTVLLFNVSNFGVRLNLRGHEMINEMINMIGLIFFGTFR